MEQRKLGSGFGRESTAADVVAGVDLTGRTAIVTGGYSGVGLETVRALAGAGARVIVPARRPELAAERLGDLAEVDALDLADLRSVAAFGQRFAARDEPLHLLVNNAGVMAAPETRVGPGWELQFATNHLGHFALTRALLPALERAAGARVVALSSLGHRQSAIRFHDLHFEQGYSKWQAYGQSKTANSLFAVELDARYRDAGIRAFAVHPGGILTELQRHLPREEMLRAGWISEDGTPQGRFKTPEQGAATATWAATSPQLDGLGGLYCEDCDVAEIVDAPIGEGPGHGVRPHAIDPGDAARLWDVSMQLTGVDSR